MDDVVWNDINDNEKNKKFPVFHATTDDDDDDDDCFWLQVGAAGVVPAVEMAVRFLRVGETAVVWSHSKYAYGAVGRTADYDNDEESLPPYTAVAYHVTVVDKVDVQHSVPNRLAFAHARKRQANDAYQHEWANGAGRPRILQAYQRLASDMEALVTTLREASDNNNNDNNNNNNNDNNNKNNYLVQAQQLRIDALNNVTAVWLRDKQYKKAKEAAVAVLQLEPTNFKALTRAAKAALLDPASEFAEVQAALEAAAAQVTHDHDALQADVEQLQTIFQRRKQMYEAKSKQMYKNAFAKSSSSSGGGGGGGRNDAGDVNKDTTTSTTTTTTTTTVVDTPATSDNKEDQAMAKESKPSSVASAAPKTDATLDDNTTSSDWWWQYGLPYGFQILLFLSMLAYVAWYHHTESSDPRTTAPIQDEF